MSTCNWLDLESLESLTAMPKNFLHIDWNTLDSIFQKHGHARTTLNISINKGGTNSSHTHNLVKSSQSY